MHGIGRMLTKGQMSTDAMKWEDQTAEEAKAEAVDCRVSDK